MYEILILAQKHDLLNAKIQSRHSTRKVYNALIQYNDFN